jgi:hypothetical protein
MAFLINNIAASHEADRLGINGILQQQQAFPPTLYPFLNNRWPKENLCWDRYIMF